MAVGHNGFLWIGTIDGLNRYDGYTITNYSSLEMMEWLLKTYSPQVKIEAM